VDDDGGDEFEEYYLNTIDTLGLVTDRWENATQGLIPQDEIWRYSKVIWFTGMSGAGKTTIAEELYKKLIEQSQEVRLLDGDVIRKELHTDLSFTPDDIKKNNTLVVELCKKLQSDNDYILVAVISPFEESRKSARERIGNDFIEVYVKSSTETLIRRDVKGLYKRALRGEIENFIGISASVPYEPPQNPDICIDTEKLGCWEAVGIILTYLREQMKPLCNSPSRAST